MYIFNQYQNLGLISWYIIFMGIVPYLISHFYKFETLKYYLPVVDLIANIFANSGSGHDKLFSHLYMGTPDSIKSFISTNLINLTALAGVAWNALDEAFHTKSMNTGMKVALVMFTLTYLFPTQVLPLFSERFQEWIDYYLLSDEDKNKRVHWERYLGGIILSVILVILETYIIHKFVLHKSFFFA